MYPENPEGTQVIVGSMNMGYISDTARNRDSQPDSVPSGSRYHYATVTDGRSVELVSRWLWASGCEPVVVSQWLWASGCRASGLGWTSGTCICTVIKPATVNNVIIVVVSQWLWASDCEPVVVSQWLWASGCLPVVVSQWLRASGCKPVVVSQWLWASFCEPVLWASGCEPVGCEPVYCEPVVVSQWLRTNAGRWIASAELDKVIPEYTIV